MSLRLAPLGRNRFLEDEALYSYWGLQIATGADPMLDWEPVDKPPLHLYVLALSFLLLGRNETAARLPSLLASVASIALVYALGRRLPLLPDGRSQPPGKTTGETCLARDAALLAALLLALSPFDILFASTAFTDPLMTALVLAALAAAAAGRLGAAGLLAGLSAATKQQGLLFLPLVVAVGFLLRKHSPSKTAWDRLAEGSLSLFIPRGAQPGMTSPPSLRAPAKQSPLAPQETAFPASVAAQARAWLLRRWRQPWLRFALGFCLAAGGALWWDAARLQRPGFVAQGLISYGGLLPAQPEALVQRAAGWLSLAAGFWASPWFDGLLIVAWLLWLMGSRRARAIVAPVRVDTALVAFAAGFLVLHWLIGFQVWDRYLLGLVPLVALLGGRALAAIGGAIPVTFWRGVYGGGLGLALAVCLAGPVQQAVCSQLPFGGDHGAYDGIDDLAAYLRAESPPGSVLYHYSLGYHYRFYLYGAPLRLHWYPDVADLVHDAIVYRREPRYIAFPSWRDDTPARTALANAGITLLPIHQTARRDGTISFRLYRLVGPTPLTRTEAACWRS